MNNSIEKEMTQSFTEFYLVNDNLVYPKICYENDISNSCMFNSSKNLNVTTMKPLIDPFSKECRIPLPSWIQSSHIYNNSSFIRKRNEKERARVKNVNEGFDRLRRHLPASIYKKEKRLSKVETLRLAISYIQQLNSILKFQRQN